MAIMTPHGLKVRWPVEVAFTLMARLWDADRRVDALRVLKTCEAVHLMPSAMAYLAGITAALTYPIPWVVGGAVLAGMLLGEMAVRMRRSMVLRLLLPLGRLWRTLHGLGLFLGPAVLVLYLRAGWGAVAWWFGAWAVGTTVKFIDQYVWARIVARKSGLVLWRSEYNFIRAYRLHAADAGTYYDIIPSRGEIDAGHWGRCLRDYAIKCPASVVRSAEMVEALATYMQLPDALLGIWASARVDRTTAENAAAFAAMLLLHGEREASDDHDDEDWHDDEEGEDEDEEHEDDDVAAKIGVGGWPYEGPRRVWVPDAKCPAAFTAVALPQAQESFNRDIYLSLLADRLAWAARRDEWDVEELRQTAMRYVPRFGETGELDDIEDLRKLVYRIVTSLPAYHALERAGAFDKPMQFNLGVAGEEDVIGTTDVREWLAELSTTQDDD